MGHVTWEGYYFLYGRTKFTTGLAIHAQFIQCKNTFVVTESSICK